MKITESQRDKICQEADEMSGNIDNIISEIKDLQKAFNSFCKETKVESYFSWTTDARLVEAIVRLNMAKTRLEEFKQDSSNLHLSESGFY